MGRSDSVVSACDRQSSGMWGAVTQWLVRATDNRVVRGAQWLVRATDNRVVREAQWLSG